MRDSDMRDRMGFLNMNSVKYPMGRAMSSPRALTGIAGLLGVDLTDPMFANIFKMYPDAMKDYKPPGADTGGGGNGGGGNPGGGGGTGGATNWQYPGLLNANYMTTNWFGK